MLQNQIGSAGNLIGKNIQGLDDQNKAVGGMVNSVNVQDGNVYLELDNGNKLCTFAGDIDRGWKNRESARDRNDQSSGGTVIAQFAWDHRGAEASARL